MRVARQHIAVITALVAFAIAACAFGVALASGNQAVPENPCANFDDSASSVVWTGSGWAAPTDEEREQNIIKQPDIIVELPPSTPEEEQQENKVEGDSDEAVVGDGGEVSDDVDGGRADDADASDDEEEDAEEPEDEATDEPEDEEEPDEGSDEQGSESNDDQLDDADDEQDEDTPSTDDDDSGATIDDVEEPSQVPDEEVDDEALYPSISTDLTDGEIISEDSRDFSVTATDYEGNVLGSDAVTVAMAADGGADVTLHPTGDDGVNLLYNLPMDGDDVAVTILAVDADGRSSMLELTVHHEVAEDVPDGSITFSVEAGTVGLGTLVGPEQVVFYEGEQMSSVLVRVLEDAGYGVVFKGSVERSFYLQHISKSGITDGWEIPEALLEHLEEVGYTETDYHTDSLGEYDFTGTAGWMYSVNGSIMSTNMSNYYPADGDEVRVRFSLYRGSDIGGDDGPQWDEEW